MADTQRKTDYLEEHLPYMLKMVRYTHGQMQQKQHYLSWNAHFESFAVNARNLMNFLSNGDRGNMKAHDFVENGFKARVQDAERLLLKLAQQVFHLAELRPKTPVGKFNSDHAAEVLEWIDKNFAIFLDALAPEQRASGQSLTLGTCSAATNR